MLGLPPQVTALLFDLDGVLTRTAVVHDAAWTDTFNRFLRHRARPGDHPFVPFDPVDDYNRYVDGRPRADGVRSFLASRGITLPDGEPDDPPGEGTVHALGNLKNELLLERIRTDGVDVYDGSVQYLTAARSAGLRTAVVSASANTADVVERTGLADLLDARMDGVVAAQRGLPGKPAPDTYLAGAALLGVPPERAAVFEDAIAGVQAGRAGGFGLVVGVDRVGHAADLRKNGADVVVTDLADLLDGPR